MRKPLPKVAAGVVGLATIVVAGVPGGSERTSYRVDAIFDSARGMVPGQLVKIGGVRVGEVSDVSLAPGPTARITFSVPARFGPFRADASCRILPEGLISENYLDCDPGDPGKPELSAGAAGRPTVSRSRTSAPVTLQNVIDIYAAPTRDRLRIVLDELGLATAGRGTDINAVLRRANPALSQARRVLAVLEQQNETLGAAIDDSNAVVRSLADDAQAVRGFVTGAAGVTEMLAERSDRLSATVRELPAMLESSDSGLRVIGRLARDGVPLADDLREAGPVLDAVTRRLGTFSRVGRPAVGAVRAAAATGRRQLPVVTGITRQLGGFAAQAVLVGAQLRDLLVSLRDTGGVESLLNLGYTLASMSSGYDSVSHMAGVYIGLSPECVAANQSADGSRSTAPLPSGCSHSFRSPGQGTVPVNAPGAGPQNQWDSVLSDAVIAGSRPTSRRARPLSRSESEMLLDFLLK